MYKTNMYVVDYIIIFFNNNNGKFFRQEAECLSQTFLAIIDLLFDSNKNSPYHKVNVKRVMLQLLEFGKPLGNSKVFVLEVYLSSYII